MSSRTTWPYRFHVLGRMVDRIASSQRARYAPRVCRSTSEGPTIPLLARCRRASSFLLHIAARFGRHLAPVRLALSTAPHHQLAHPEPVRPLVNRALAVSPLARFTLTRSRLGRHHSPFAVSALRR